jgi:putative MFS transporter
VAACSKLGGLIAQGLSITALVPPLGIAALMIMLPISLGLVLVMLFGRETRGIDLRTLDRPQPVPLA